MSMQVQPTLHPPSKSPTSRRRSSSKTQQNYHPINETSLADLSTDLSTPPQSHTDSTAEESHVHNNTASLNSNINMSKNLSLSLSLINENDTQVSNHVQNANDNDNKLAKSNISTKDTLNNVSTQDLKNNNIASRHNVSKKTANNHLSGDIKEIDDQISNTSKANGLSHRKLPIDQYSRSSSPLQSNKSVSHRKKNNEPLFSSLKKSVHVVRLISPEQPDEYLKVLSIPLYPETLKIGRQNTPKTSNKITDGFFDSRVLSRNHAELFIKDNFLYIRDLKSSNGTFLNDVKLEPYKEYKLNINDKVDLGTTLESQMAHKKITCIIKEFDYISLANLDLLIEEINNKDELVSRKLELFNNMFDAILFGEMIDDVVIGIENPADPSNSEMSTDLLSLIKEDEKNHSNNGSSKKIKVKSKFVKGLDLKPSQTQQDVVKKLTSAVNNEYIQQQRLKEITFFLQNYNNSLAAYESTSMFKLYDRILKQELSTSCRNSSNTGPDSKFLKLEEKLKSTMCELDAARQHLCTAKAREDQYKKIQTENVELEKSLKISNELNVDFEKRLMKFADDLATKQDHILNLEKKLKVLQESQTKSADTSRAELPANVDVTVGENTETKEEENSAETTEKNKNIMSESRTKPSSSSPVPSTLTQTITPVSPFSLFLPVGLFGKVKSFFGTNVNLQYRYSGAALVTMVIMYCAWPALSRNISGFFGQ